MKNNRRKLLKALTLGGGAATAWKLPAEWSKPIVESVTLPAHAQTTSDEESTPTLRRAASTGATPVNITLHENVSSSLFAANPDMLRRLMDVYLPNAHAFEGLMYPADAQVYGAERADGKWEFEIFLDYGDLCDDFDTFSPYVCRRDEVRLEDKEGLYDAFIQKAHAEPTPTYTFQTLFTTGPLDIGDVANGLTLDSGCDFGAIDFEFVALNGDSPEVKVSGTTLNLFSGSKPFGSPTCDEIMPI